MSTFNILDPTDMLSQGCAICGNKLELKEVKRSIHYKNENYPTTYTYMDCAHCKEQFQTTEMIARDMAVLGGEYLECWHEMQRKYGTIEGLQQEVLRLRKLLQEEYIKRQQ